MENMMMGNDDDEEMTKMMTNTMMKTRMKKVTLHWRCSWQTAMLQTGSSVACGQLHSKQAEMMNSRQAVPEPGSQPSMFWAGNDMSIIRPSRVDENKFGSMAPRALVSPEQ